MHTCAVHCGQFSLLAVETSYCCHSASGAIFIYNAVLWSFSHPWNNQQTILSFAANQSPVQYTCLLLQLIYVYALHFLSATSLFGTFAITACSQSLYSIAACWHTGTGQCMQSCSFRVIYLFYLLRLYSTSAEVMHCYLQAYGFLAVSANPTTIVQQTTISHWCSTLMDNLRCHLSYCSFFTATIKYNALQILMAVSNQWIATILYILPTAKEIVR